MESAIIYTKINRMDQIIRIIREAIHIKEMINVDEIVGLTTWKRIY